MRELEGYVPRRGLSVPLLTALDARGGLDEASQRRLVRHTVSDGHGADILFVGGTTGEAQALPAPLRERLTEIVVDEARLLPAGVEVWAGVTARTRRETLDLLAHAVRAGADAAVLAPLSVADLDDVLAFFQHEVRDALEEGDRMIPVFLYDNADIATDPKAGHLRTALVKRLSRLAFVRGVKVSASMPVLGNYAKAASHFNALGSFGIYVGNARLVFDIFDTDKGPFRRYLDRFLLNWSLPVGVVAGQANVFPREWQDAWRVSVAGDERGIARYRAAFGRLSEACRPGGKGRAAACLKRALHRQGILATETLAPGTPALAPAEGTDFDAAVDAIRADLAKDTPPRWITPLPQEASR